MLQGLFIALDSRRLVTLNVLKETDVLCQNLSYTTFNAKNTRFKAISKRLSITNTCLALTSTLFTFTCTIFIETSTSVTETSTPATLACFRLNRLMPPYYEMKLPFAFLITPFTPTKLDFT